MKADDYEILEWRLGLRLQPSHVRFQSFDLAVYDRTTYRTVAGRQFTAV